MFMCKHTFIQIHIYQMYVFTSVDVYVMNYVHNFQLWIYPHTAIADRLSTFHLRFTRIDIHMYMFSTKFGFKCMYLYIFTYI